MRSVHKWDKHEKRFTKRQISHYGKMNFVSKELKDYPLLQTNTT